MNSDLCSKPVSYYLHSIIEDLESAYSIRARTPSELSQLETLESILPINAVRRSKAIFDDEVIDSSTGPGTILVAGNEDLRTYKFINLLTNTALKNNSRMTLLVGMNQGKHLVSLIMAQLVAKQLQEPENIPKQLQLISRNANLICKFDLKIIESNLSSLPDCVQSTQLFVAHPGIATSLSELHRLRSIATQNSTRIVVLDSEKYSSSISKHFDKTYLIQMGRCD